VDRLTQGYLQCRRLITARMTFTFHCSLYLLCLSSAPRKFFFGILTLYKSDYY